MRILGRRVRTRIAAIVAALSALACSTVRTDVLQVGPPQEPRTDPERIVVYAADDPRAPLAPPNVKVGEIAAKDSKKPLANIITKMKEDAAGLGADVLIVEADRLQAGDYRAFGTSRPRLTNFVKATAIRLQQ